MKNKKTPGPEGISAEVYKPMFWPKLLPGAFNACPKEGIFPSRLKVESSYWSAKGKVSAAAWKVRPE